MKQSSVQKVNKKGLDSATELKRKWWIRLDIPKEYMKGSALGLDYTKCKFSVFILCVSSQ